MGNTIKTRRLPRWVGEAAVTYLREHGLTGRNVTRFLRTMPMQLEACTKVHRGVTTVFISRLDGPYPTFRPATSR